MPEGEVEERRRRGGRRGIEYRMRGQTARSLALAVKGICVESGRSRVARR